MACEFGTLWFDCSGMPTHFAVNGVSLRADFGSCSSNCPSFEEFAAFHLNGYAENRLGWHEELAVLYTIPPLYAFNRVDEELLWSLLNERGRARMEAVLDSLRLFVEEVGAIGSRYFPLYPVRDAVLKALELRPWLYGIRPRRFKALEDFDESLSPYYSPLVVIRHLLKWYYGV